MMTALNIEDKKAEGAAKVLRLFRHNRLRVEHSYCDSAALKSISYEHYRGKVGWANIDRFVKAQRNRVLCPKDLSLPKELGYKRYEPHTLMHKLCLSTSLWLLHSVTKRAKVVLVDNDGEYADVCKKLCEYCDPVFAVTENIGLYIEKAQALLNEKGAALRVSKNPGVMLDADLIIAPKAITHPLPCQPNAVVLSGEKPSAEAPAPIIYRYFFDLPSKFSEIKPPYLDDMYFAAALYEMSDVKELAGELFTRAADDTVLHTRLSLKEALLHRLSHSQD